MPRPKRAFELEIRIGGDTWEDVLAHVRDLLPHIEDHGLACNSVSGSPSAYHSVEITQRPEMTHERFIKELDEHIAELKVPSEDGICELCGKPMPDGEKMFRYHGHSGPCPT